MHLVIGFPKYSVIVLILAGDPHSSEAYPKDLRFSFISNIADNVLSVIQ